MSIRTPVARLAYQLMLPALLLPFLTALGFAAEPITIPSAYDKLVSEYMLGKWDDLQANLKPNTIRLATFTASQRTDIDYIRKTIAECHAFWWARCKAGKLTQIHQPIFSAVVTALYDPQQKQGMSAKISESSMSFTLGWPSQDMDNPALAEHGFTVGELNAATIWSTLGMSAQYEQLPFESLINLDEPARVKLTRVLDFRGSLATAYYASPRTRRWWFFLAMHYYRPQYAKTPILMSRKALAAMFVAEVVSHRDQYPSISLSAVEDQNGAEEKLVAAVHDQIEKHAWTLSEDNRLRDATRAMALANASLWRTGGPVRVSNVLQMSLAPETDAPFRAQRDHWFAQELAGR